MLLSKRLCCPAKRVTNVMIAVRSLAMRKGGLPWCTRAAVECRPVYVRQIQSSDWIDRWFGVKKLRAPGNGVRSAALLKTASAPASGGAHFSARRESSDVGAVGTGGLPLLRQWQAGPPVPAEQQHALGFAEQPWTALRTLVAAIEKTTAQPLPSLAGTKIVAQTIDASEQSAVAVLQAVCRLNMGKSRCRVNIHCPQEISGRPGMFSGTFGWH